MQNSIEEKSAMISLRKGELSSIGNELEQKRDELNRVRISLELYSQELQLRKDELLLQQDSMGKYSAIINRQKDELVSVRNLVEQKNAELHSISRELQDKKDELQSAEHRNMSCFSELGMENNKLLVEVEGSNQLNLLKSKENEYDDLSQARSDLLVEHLQQHQRMFNVSQLPSGELLGSAETLIRSEAKKEQSGDSVELYKDPVGGLESKKVQCPSWSSSENQPLQKRRCSERLEDLKLRQVTQKPGTSAP